MLVLHGRARFACHSCTRGDKKNGQTRLRGRRGGVRVECYALFCIQVVSLGLFRKNPSQGYDLLLSDLLTKRGTRCGVGGFPLVRSHLAGSTILLKIPFSRTESFHLPLFNVSTSFVTPLCFSFSLSRFFSLSFSYTLDGFVMVDGLSSPKVC